MLPHGNPHSFDGNFIALDGNSKYQFGEIANVQILTLGQIRDPKGLWSFSIDLLAVVQAPAVSLKIRLPHHSTPAAFVLSMPVQEAFQPQYRPRQREGRRQIVAAVTSARSCPQCRPASG